LYVSLSERGDRTQRVNVETHFCCLYDVMSWKYGGISSITTFGNEVVNLHTLDMDGPSLL